MLNVLKLRSSVYILKADYRGKMFKVAESIFYRRITEEVGLKLQGLCFIGALQKKKKV